MPIEEVSPDEERRVNTNLTPEEAEMIKELRVSKKETLAMAKTVVTLVP